MKNFFRLEYNTEDWAEITQIINVGSIAGVSVEREL
jgi:hypothetical protein